LHASAQNRSATGTQQDRHCEGINRTNVLVRFRVSFGASFFELTQGFPTVSPSRNLAVYLAFRSAPLTGGFGIGREIELVFLTNRRTEKFGCDF